MGDARPVILALHGFSGRGSDFDALAAALPEYRFVAPDLPGHGPRPVMPATLSAHLDVVRRAAGDAGERPVLLGYSMGGRIALHAALAFPEMFSALVPVGASPGLADAGEREARLRSDAELAARIRKTDTAVFLREWDALPLLAGRDRMPEPWKSRSLAARLENTPEGLAASLDGAGTGALPSHWERLGELRLPVLVLAGDHDAKFTAIAGRMTAAIPGARFAPVPGSGHAAPMEAPAATAGAIRHNGFPMRAGTGPAGG